MYCNQNYCQKNKHKIASSKTPVCESRHTPSMAIISIVVTWPSSVNVSTAVLMHVCHVIHNVHGICTNSLQMEYAQTPFKVQRNHTNFSMLPFKLLNAYVGSTATVVSLLNEIYYVTLVIAMEYSKVIWMWYCLLQNPCHPDLPKVDLCDHLPKANLSDLSTPVSITVVCWVHSWPRYAFIASYIWYSYMHLLYSFIHYFSLFLWQH